MMKPETQLDTKYTKIAGILIFTTLIVGLIVSLYRQADNLSIGAPTKSLQESLTILQAEQETLKTRYGKYPTISENGTILIGQTPVDEYKNITLPAGMTVRSWKSTNGVGFQIVYQTATTVQSWGFGTDTAEVDSRTYSYPYISPAQVRAGL